jgi:hypothetical protein
MDEFPPLIPITGRQMDELPPLIPVTGRKNELPPLIPIASRNVHKMNELLPLIPIADKNLHSYTLSYTTISVIFNITLSVIYISIMNHSYEIGIFLTVIPCLSIANFIFLLNVSVNDWYRPLVFIISIDIIKICLVIYVVIANFACEPLLMLNVPIIILIKIERALAQNKFDANKHLYSIQV